MKLTTYKINLAYAILMLLQNQLENIEDEKKSGYVDVFENCREQGFRIHVSSYQPEYKHMTFAFSENRNSDSIVVYYSNKLEGFQNEYSEEFWDSRKYFKYNEQYQAAEYIKELIESM